MKSFNFFNVLLVSFFTLTSFITDEHKTLEIGARAHDFKLQGID